MAEKRTDTPDRGESCTPSFLTGLYLAVNAVSDAYAVVDGTDCVTRKAECVHGSHDLFSTLLDCRGDSRVLHTGSHAGEIIAGDSSGAEARADALCGRAGVVLLSSLPVMTLTGRDYGKLAASLTGRRGTRVVSASANALDFDYLDGYALALERMAADMPLKKGAGRRGKVAVVGHFMDRNEGDQTGNLAELRRMLALAGLDLVCAWPGGSDYASLKEAEQAGLIISLPYARGAAATLARRTGARLLELELPLGLAASAAWLKAAAGAAGISAVKADAIIAEELSGAHSLARTAVGGALAGKRLCFTGDPYLGKAVCAFAAELGMGVAGVFLTCSGGKWASAEAAFPGRPVLRDFPVLAYGRAIEELFSGGRCDLLVSSSVGRRSALLGLPGMDLGFPSYRYHALRPEPFLGFSGAVNLVQRMFNAARSA
ncbi:MAG: hypothetical protein M0011_11970 [Elusimicrobia bacterium]|nr:hypothetical protein [Elusimicrobiota bacterium]